MSESAKRHEENSNLIKEIQASTDAAIRNQGASIKTLEIQIGQMSKVLQERGFRSLPSSTKTNLRDHVKSISTIVEADSYPIRRTLMYETKQMTIPFLSRELAHTKLTVELADMTVKYPKGIAENVLVEVGIKARRFNGMITIYNGNESVTYQMVGSHSRFKHHTNEQCNKIPPLLKEAKNKQDEWNPASIPKANRGSTEASLKLIDPLQSRDAKTGRMATTRAH
ncbi:hypothetical protein Tco_0494862 [Tanacetum coccineum]